MGMHVGVIGAGGRLGNFVIDTIVKNEFSATAISTERKASWPESVKHVHHSNRSDYTALTPVFETLNVVIIAAGLTSTTLHQLALQSGCHVIDAGASENNIKACLELSNVARSAGKCLITMAGLAPGLMGLLAIHMSEAFPDTIINLCLTQSSKGSAGEQGTRDMLDMLTDRKRSTTIECSIVTDIGKMPVQTNAYIFPTADRTFLSDLPKVTYTTRFDGSSLNNVLKLLRSLRTVSPALYRFIRNKAAKQKRSSTVHADERILLSAAAIAEDGSTLGTAARAFKSDYGATSAVALALADLAFSGKFNPTVGHPCKFTNWAELVDHAIVRREEAV